MQHVMKEHPVTVDSYPLTVNTYLILFFDFCYFFCFPFGGLFLGLMHGMQKDPKSGADHAESCIF